MYPALEQEVIAPTGETDGAKGRPVSSVWIHSDWTEVERLNFITINRAIQVFTVCHLLFNYNICKCIINTQKTPIFLKQLFSEK